MSLSSEYFPEHPSIRSASKGGRDHSKTRPKAHARKSLLGILFILGSSYFLHSNSREKSLERNIYLFLIEKVELKKRVNTVHVRDQKHELASPRDRYPCDNGYKKVTDFPPRDIVYDQDIQLIGLRDKPITQQDALLKSESPPRFLLRQDPLSPFEASPLSSFLKQERKEYVIEEFVPNDPGANAPRADKDKFNKHMDDMLDVGCHMLATMTPELQKQHEDMVAYEMIQNLKEIYEGKARQERYETSKALFQCKMSEGSPMGAHVIKMMGYIQTLEKLGFALNDELTLPQLLGMLRIAEGNMKKGGSKPILMVHEAKGKGKKVAKSKGIGKTKPKGKEAFKPKGGVSKDGKCFHCGKPGHWKRNCPIYLEDVKKAKAVGASVSCIYVIDINMSTSSSWVLDTGCGSHICTSVQGLHMRRNLAKGDVDLQVGNGARVVALVVGTYILSLPSGLILNLEIVILCLV
ncbi:hypothetical protein GQ457_14G020970 [Hibiscus cannabinus]